jgi:hypothetical protein
MGSGCAFACKSMNRVQKQKHLALANRHIAELTVQLARQRVIVKHAGTGLILAFLVHTHYPGALGLREWIRVVLSWPLIFFMRSKSEARRSNAKIRSRTTTPL